jgi:hypothetical protein
VASNQEIACIRADGQAHLPDLQGPGLASFGVFAAAVRQRRGG